MNGLDDSVAISPRMSMNSAAPPPPSHPGYETSQDLLNQAAWGNESAFQEIIKIHGRRLYAIAYSILQNQTEAEEIVQDTFVKAYRELGSFREADKFPGWLNLVTRNAARDVLRKRRPQAEEEALAQLEDHQIPKPGARLDEEHVQGQLKRALASLPEEHRTAITLRYLEGLDYQGIESVMGLSNGALRGILGRALGTLRNRLQPLRMERSSL
jgi:RNA polymerase sigma-70 factor (ECF subfamily)